MKKTILFPTDFSIQSLNIVKSVLNDKNDGQKYDIILLHGFHSGDSITDLLFASKTRWVDELTNNDFEDACEVIRNKFESRIRTIRKDVFTGYNQSAFDYYVEVNNITEAYLPVNYKLQVSHRRSFDIVPFIQKSNLMLKEIVLNDVPVMPERGRLAEVFHSQMAYH